MTALKQTTRYFAPEISQCVFVPVIASVDLEYTRTELTAGTILTKEIADLSGWRVAGADINVPDLGSRFVSTIPGRTNADSSSITFYASLDGDDVRKVQTPGLNGFIVWMDGGDVAEQPSDVFPVRVRSVGKVRSVQDQAMQITVEYSITSTPGVDIEIPATA